MNETQSFDINTLTGASLEAAKSVYKQGGGDNDVIATLRHNNLLPGQEQNETDSSINIDNKNTFWDKTKDNWDKFVNESFESAGATKRGEQSIIENIGQQFGNTASLGVDQILSGIGSVYSSLGEPLKEEAVSTLKAIGNTSAGQVALEALSKGVDEWNVFADENPRAARNIEGVFESLQVIPTPTGIISKTVTGGSKIKNKGIAKFFENRAKALGQNAQDLKKGIDSDITSLLQPSVKEFTKVGFDEVPKALEDAIKVIKPVNSFEEMGANINNVKNLSLKTGDSIVKINPNKPLNPDAILKPLKLEIDKISKDPQRIGEFKILTNVFKKESELLQKEAIIGGFGQSRKKDINAILSPYLEKLDLNVAENSHKSALDLLRKGYKNEMDNVYGPIYKKNNEMASSMIKADVLLKQQRARALKGTEEGLTKKAVRRFLLLRSVANKSPFIGSFIDRLTPEELMTMYSKRISNDKIKLASILKKKNLLTEKAFKANQDLIANELLNIVGREYVGQINSILPLIKSYIDKHGPNIKDKIGDLLEELVDKLGARNKFISDKDVMNFSKKIETQGLVGKEKSNAYWTLKILEEQQRLKNPKFKKDIGEGGFNSNDFFDDGDGFTPKADNMKILEELGLMDNKGLFTTKLHNTFPSFKTDFPSLGKGLHKPIK